MRSYCLAMVAALAAALILGGCNTGNGVVTVASTQSQLRVVNLIPNAGAPINVTIDDNPLVSGLNFESLVPYQTINAVSNSNPTRTIKATVESAVAQLIITTVAPIGEAQYSYIMYGPITAPKARLYDDTFTDPGAGNFNLRVINAAAGIGAVDVYLTAPGADLNLVAPSVSGAVYDSVGGFATIPFGNLQLRVTPTGSKSVIYDAPPQNYVERSAVDVVVYTRGSSTLANVVVLNIDSTGNGSFFNNLLAQFKVVNASTVASALNVFFDGALKLSNIPVTGATGYQRSTSGAHTLTVEATAAPGATLLTYSPVLTPAMDSSIVLEGSAGALQAITLADNNLPPGPGNAKVRVVNASADVAAIDVFVNFSKQLSAVPRNSGAYAIELAADSVTGTTFQFSFIVAGTTQTLLTLPSVTLIGTRNYTIYVVGPGTALSAGVTQDS
jgi:hypothetical protein